ncbi:MAG: hypothetical protein KatS3mg129_1660 [Leptospiraceae bacterium]|nr:MAG: hypothetical protein KatS3mg129_1660 [Leptospiraceae bacterium]
MSVIKFYVNLLITSFYLFLKDKLQIRANAIAYSIIVAIIPLLTVLMRIANINQQELLENINRIFSIYGITGAQPIIEIIQDILSRANTISGIGLIFLIYASLNIFQHLEESANQIFRVESRGFLIRTSIYTSWLVFIPLVLVFLFDFSKKIQNILTPPDNISIVNNGKKFFILDESKKIEIYNQDFHFQETIDFIKKTDLLALNRKIIINQEEFNYDLTGDSIKTFIKEAVKLEIDRDLVLVVCNPGFLFFSLDAGFNWDFRYFIFSNKGKSFELPIIEDIKTFRNQIYVLLTLGKQTYLYILDKGYFDVIKRFVFDSFYNKIYIYENRIFLTGQGMLLFSDIGLWDWNYITIPQINFTFDSIFMNPDFAIFLSATKRVFIFENGKIFYPLIRINQLNHIINLKIFNDGKGFIIGTDIRFTLNYGRDWYITKFYDINNKEIKLFPINDVYKKKNTFYFIGDNRSIYVAEIFSIAIDPVTDLPLIKFKVHYKNEISKLRLYLPGIIVLLLNYTYIVILFTFFYMILPNKKIPIKSAFIGGLIGSIGTILFMGIFKFLLPFFTSSRLIYGIWFSIPIAMMILLITIEIFLFGLEVTRVHMNPNLVSNKIYKKFLNYLKK